MNLDTCTYLLPTHLQESRLRCINSSKRKQKRLGWVVRSFDKSQPLTCLKAVTLAKVTSRIRFQITINKTTFDFRFVRSHPRTGGFFKPHPASAKTLAFEVVQRISRSLKEPKRGYATVPRDKGRSLEGLRGVRGRRGRGEGTLNWPGVIILLSEKMADGMLRERMLVRSGG